MGGVVLALKSPNKYTLPLEILDAHLLYETGWDPEVLDRQPLDRVLKYILYRNTRLAIDAGIGYDP